MSGGPIRMTRERAHALLWAIDIGITNELDELKQTFGVRVQPDGTADLDDEDYALLDPSQAEELRDRLDNLANARAAAQIFEKRYA